MLATMSQTHLSTVPTSEYNNDILSSHFCVSNIFSTFCVVVFLGLEMTRVEHCMLAGVSHKAIEICCRRYGLSTEDAIERKLKKDAKMAAQKAQAEKEGVKVDSLRSRLSRRQSRILKKSKSKGW